MGAAITNMLEYFSIWVKDRGHINFFFFLIWPISLTILTKCLYIYIYTWPLDKNEEQKVH